MASTSMADATPGVVPEGVLRWAFDVKYGRGWYTVHVEELPVPVDRSELNVSFQSADTGRMYHSIPRWAWTKLRQSLYHQHQRRLRRGLSRPLVPGDFGNPLQ